jgi:Molybdopterin oxidoreductase
MRIVPGDRTSEFRTASWDEALSFVVSKITELRAADGPDAIGCFGGGGLTNEKAYAFGKFARVALRTSMIDYNGHFCMSSAATAANRAFGIDRGLPFPLTDIAKPRPSFLSDPTRPKRCHWRCSSSMRAGPPVPPISSSIRAEQQRRRARPGIWLHGQVLTWRWRTVYSTC